MTTNQLKMLFNKKANKYFTERNRLFEIDQENKNFLNVFCKYFAQDKSFETEHGGELRKGLYVFGNVGTGKTSNFEILQKVSKDSLINQIWVPMIHTHKVVEEFNLSNSSHKDYVIKYYSNGKYLFDDLGSENQASNYGKEDIFTRILELRYSNYMNKGTKTFITSNLSLTDIKNRYGSRIFDRFLQMFNILELNGKSRRF